MFVPSVHNIRTCRRPKFHILRRIMSRVGAVKFSWLKSDQISIALKNGLEMVSFLYYVGASDRMSRTDRRVGAVAVVFRATSVWPQKR